MKKVKFSTIFILALCLTSGIWSGCNDDDVQITEPITVTAKALGGPKISVANESQSDTAKIFIEVSGTFTVSVNASGNGTGSAILDFGFEPSGERYRLETNEKEGEKIDEFSTSYELSIPPQSSIELPGSGSGLLQAEAVSDSRENITNSFAKTEGNILLITNNSDVDLTIISRDAGFYALSVERCNSCNTPLTGTASYEVGPPFPFRIETSESIVSEPLFQQSFNLQFPLPPGETFGGTGTAGDDFFNVGAEIF